MHRVCRNPPMTNFNPRSPHGERPASPLSSSILRMISIHAPRTGSDSKYMRDVLDYLKISIHAPRTGSDEANHIFFGFFANFNPRSPHGERQVVN